MFIISKKFIHKYIIFYPKTLRFSNEGSFNSDSPDYLSTIIPKDCATFRQADIFCTIIDEDYQFIIETENLLKSAHTHVNLFIVKTILAGGIYESTSDSFKGVGSTSKK